MIGAEACRSTRGKLSIAPPCWFVHGGLGVAAVAFCYRTRPEGADRWEDIQYQRPLLDVGKIA